MIFNNGPKPRNCSTSALSTASRGETELIAAADIAAYGAVTARLKSLTRAWAAAYGPVGVRVSAVSVGPMLTRRPSLLWRRWNG
nr:SDR family oxidoreductase [Microbacterium bovistercoris]